MIGMLPYTPAPMAMAYDSNGMLSVYFLFMVAGKDVIANIIRLVSGREGIGCTTRKAFASVTNPWIFHMSAGK